MIEAAFQFLGEILPRRDDEVRLTGDGWPVPTRAPAPSRFVTEAPATLSITQIALQASSFDQRNGLRLNALIVVVKRAGKVDACWVIDNVEGRGGNCRPLHTCQR